MMMRFGGSAIIAGILAWSGWLSHAAGQPDDPSSASLNARQHFELGRAAFEDGRFSEAAEEWSQAYELEPRPRILFNLGQVYERTGQLVEALDAYQRFIDSADESDAGAQVTARARAAALRERLAQTGIQVVGAPDGAEIFVDEQEWGMTPRPDPVRVEPGSHELRLVHRHYEDFDTTVVVAPGQVADVEVHMARRPEFPEPTRPVPAYVLMGSGAAIAIAGGALGGVALGRARDASSESGSEAVGARRMALAADILLGVGAATALAGLVWFLMRRESSEDREESAAITIQPRFSHRYLGADTTVEF